MTCDRRDQELLLLAHGALSWPRRVAAQAHLRRCASCCKRYARLAQVSSTLAGALSVPNTTPWTPGWGLARAQGATFGPRLLAGLSVLLIALTVTLLYLVFSKPQTYCTPGGTSASTHPADGCAPNLPNDRCR